MTAKRKPKVGGPFVSVGPIDLAEPAKAFDSERYYSLVQRLKACNRTRDPSGSVSVVMNAVAFGDGLLSGLKGGSVFSDDDRFEVHHRVSPWFDDMCAIGDDMRAAIDEVVRSLNHDQRKRQQHAGEEPKTVS